jgi:hypothetical protein
MPYSKLAVKNHARLIHMSMVLSWCFGNYSLICLGLAWVAGRYIILAFKRHLAKLHIRCGREC